MDLFIACIILAICVLVSYKLGTKEQNSTVTGVQKYLATEFKDEHTAYKKGITEGYAQGMRDGKHDESA